MDVPKITHLISVNIVIVQIPTTCPLVNAASPTQNLRPVQLQFTKFPRVSSAPRMNCASSSVDALALRMQNHLSFANGPRCRAAGCCEAHSSHYCKNCGNTNSDHKSNNCPNRQKQPQYSKKVQILTSANQPNPTNCREDYMMLVTWVAINECHCSIFGGFVRDYIIRNERPNDIDIRLPHNDLQAFMENFERRLQSLGFTTHFLPLQVKGHKVSIREHQFELDLVCKDDFGGGKLVDMDVNNLMISKAGLSQRAGINRSIEQIVSNILRKRCCIRVRRDIIRTQLAYYKQRIQKMINRGWNVINKDKVLHLNC